MKMLLMTINGIIAINFLNVIGDGGYIPWHLSEDIKFFKCTTLNSTVVMGRKTFNSLTNGPLTNRINVVLTRNEKYAEWRWRHYDDKNLYFYVNLNINQILFDLEQFIKYKEVFIIGGVETYKLFEKYIQRWYISRVENYEKGDTLYTYFDTDMFKEKFFQSRLLVKSDKVKTYQYDLIV